MIMSLNLHHILHIKLLIVYLLTEVIIIIINFGTMPISLLVDSRDCTGQEKVT